ncbi:MAG: hypothetical protein KIS67_12960 [Verrucomicrobiae bacterium]|nr:hypothetical protein [Verrucomicrobiae bacterium]
MRSLSGCFAFNDAFSDAMNTCESLYNLTRTQGLFLSYWSPSAFVVYPAENLNPALEQILRAHQSELVPWLRAQAGPWLHLCKQIVLGEFDGATPERIEILARCLANDPHPLRQAALQRLLCPDDE